MPPFSLLEAAWLPVRRRSGAKSLIRPAEIASGSDDPIVAFAWGRPDFDAASREFMIGLLATAFPPPANNLRKWEVWWKTPPTPAQLGAAFAPFAAAFVLDGDGPRFCQDFEALDRAKVWPVEKLLIEQPSKNTLENNRDLFQKRSQILLLSRPAAAMALYTLQTFAPSGGPGHLTSLRGGGPMTTLIEAPDECSLWQFLWLNTPQENETYAAAGEEMDRVFPWLSKTFSWDGKPRRVVAPHNERAPWTAHSLQAFWGMPRRIHLVFVPNDNDEACPISGDIDDFFVREFRIQTLGVQYDASFLHPLSPYRLKEQIWLPRHPRAGGVPYKDWPSFAGAEIEKERRVAEIVPVARNRLASENVRETRLLVSGYDIVEGQAIARGFVEARMPLFILPKRANAETGARIYDLAQRLADAGDHSSNAVAKSIRKAVVGISEREKKAVSKDGWEEKEVKSDFDDTHPVSALRERFFQETETAFFDLLRKAFNAAETLSESAARKPFEEEWLGVLRRRGIDLFDEAVSFSDMPEKIMDRAAPARRSLIGTFAGYGALGKKLFTALELPPPEAAGKAGTGAKKSGKGR